MNRNGERQGEEVIQEATERRQRLNSGSSIEIKKFKKKEKIQGTLQRKKKLFIFFQLNTRTDESRNKNRDNSDYKHYFLTQMVTKMVTPNAWFYPSDIHMVVVVRIFIHMKMLITGFHKGFQKPLSLKLLLQRKQNEKQTNKKQ